MRGSICEWDNGNSDGYAHGHFEFWRMVELRYRHKREPVLGNTDS